ncbi:4Fe-4S binding protein [Thermosulfurimonas dismutans]|uniref:CoB--CoM heterodisulfide reductase iron-sulfur subunit C n=1 Tax=Thermosulfurimonas dismutans TaxID=999894 RepID=A0A179D4B4_9BACT|nr:4Fe-4S binding protein [Thermosulfurimonas dismutans]OAQ20876.1 CoB--CoM heterodisulfide reductase iron-sulfur subunit C [Thermosulfurimonas dismutans]
MELTVEKNWVSEVKSLPETLAQCFRCGACSGICPVKRIRKDFDPRVIVHATILGIKDKLFGTPILWHCSQCQSCVPVCPMEVKPAEVIKALRDYALKEGLASEETLFEAGRLARVNPKKCIVCLTCVRVCPFGAPSIKDEGYAVIDPAKCHACGICVQECPARAIELHPAAEFATYKWGV